MYQRIVVPLDGSELAELALIDAREMARMTNAPMYIIRSVDYRYMAGFSGFGVPSGAAGAAALVEAEEAAVAPYLDKIATQLTEAGIQVQTEVLHGVAAREIVSVLKPGDLLVMATHGRGGVTRWLLGSVAEDVLRHAPVPVLLVRAGNVDVSAPGKGAALVS